MSTSEAPLYEKIISENPEKGTQLRLVVSEFRDVQYVHLRKYFMSYDEGYLPTKEGASMPATISSIYALLDGLIEICSYEESIDSITKHFQEKINALANNSRTKEEGDNQ
jgi:Transcriptional Coactivator p15 (PC4)